MKVIAEITTLIIYDLFLYSNIVYLFKTQINATFYSQGSRWAMNRYFSININYKLLIRMMINGKKVVLFRRFV